MKTLILLLTILSTTVHSKDLCTEIELLAESIIKGKQKGVAMSKMIKVAADNKMLKRMIITAYDLPNYTTGDYNEKQVVAYKTRYYSACVKESLK